MTNSTTTISIVAHEVRSGIFGATCPICELWSTMDARTGALAETRACSHALYGEVRNSELRYVVFGVTPEVKS